MQDLMSMLTSLKRPNLLVKAAQLGLPDYRRKTHLPRILQSPAPASNGAAALRLLELEQHINELRCARDASYSARRHVDVLIALLSEAAVIASGSGRASTSTLKPV
jgi:hypothetical protein